MLGVDLIIGMVIVTKDPSFFLSWVSKTQPNYRINYRCKLHFFGD